MTTKKGAPNNGKSLPEIGRTFRRIHRDSYEKTGKPATGYRLWQGALGLGKRHEAIVRKDPQAKDPRTDRSAEIAAAVWKWRQLNGTKTSVD